MRTADAGLAFERRTQRTRRELQRVVEDEPPAAFDITPSNSVERIYLAHMKTLSFFDWTRTGIPFGVTVPFALALLEYLRIVETGKCSPFLNR